MRRFLRPFSALALFALPAAAGEHPTLGGISTGALLGIVATWVGISIAYANLRRAARNDAERSAEAMAARIAGELIERRARDFIPRAEQERINQQNDERYRSLADMRMIATEIRELTKAIEESRRRSGGREP